MNIISDSSERTRAIGKKIAGKVKPGDIICLFGELGSGKTVLAKGIASGLGIEKSRVISPSFVLLRQHLKGRLPLYHFDLYRLKSCEDIQAAGYEEYLFGQGVSVIEWADRLKYLLPKEFLKIELRVAGASQRMLKLIPVGARYKDLIKGLR
ncbi:MAG: tRNA (adenosine(37)-N6)-threonylcarbamoyltransferase complex ATPase subunit type 1 TsaE [Candidatus Omnitrophica bacterium]|nr:tRNA (adenosine(37)-N6)-threonylcarbamoyltransferase complex ATPase subunit type 1 TsaE [Candidatus Omnitrophota bacterium]